MRVLILWADERSANLGVRVLAQGTTALVRRAHPDAEVACQSYGHGPAPANIGVPRTLLRDRLTDAKGLRRWVRSFDYVVDTRAGDSFADIYGLQRLVAMGAMGEFVRSCGVPLVLGPQTIGPFDTRRGRAVGQWSLRRATTVMARDPLSADAARALGREVDVLTTDVVFALDTPEPGPERDVLFNVSGLLWNSDSHGPASDYRHLVRSLLHDLRERGRTVTLLSHVLEGEGGLDSDGEVVRVLGDELGLDHVVPTSLADVRATMRGARLVLGSRMHACLNALSVGTPALPLAYSRKFAPLLAAIGWPHVVSLADPNARRTVGDLLDHPDDLTAGVASVLATARPMLDSARDALRSVV